MKVRLDVNQLNNLVTGLQKLKANDNIIGKYSVRVNLNLNRTFSTLQECGNEEQQLKEKHIVGEGDDIDLKNPEEYYKQMNELMSEKYTFDLMTIPYDYLKDKEIDIGLILPIIEDLPEEYEELLEDIEFIE